MPISSRKLHHARAAKNDEFYTQYADVKKECDNYLSHFFNKIIYCNCDTSDSAFVRYFMELKQRGLVRDVWYSGGLGGLDFRSPDAIRMLERADVVVTNPPFSLFREYVDLLIQYDKKFLIIGNHNAVKYKNIFPLIKTHKIWIGNRGFGGGMFFDVPNPDDLLKKDKSSYKIIDGIPRAVVPATWFTNLPVKKRDKLPLCKKYNPIDYPKYDNADAINVNSKRDIPCDYFDVMGVPSTFIDRYNPDQFILLGIDREFTTNKQTATLNSRRLYTRIFVRLKR